MNMRKVFLSTVAGIVAGIGIDSMFSIPRGVRSQRATAYKKGGSAFTKGKRVKSQRVRSNRRSAKAKR